MRESEINNLLFIQGGSRWKFDSEGNVYTDSNFNENIWDRYRHSCINLIVVLRREETVYSLDIAERKFNSFDSNKSTYVALPDLYRPVKNVLSLSIRREIKANIEKQVKNADKVIIRSLGNIYTNSALKFCRKYNKPYLVEVTGFAFEGLWYHSLRGKIVAPFKELQYRYFMRNVKYAAYVTQEALQKRYPCKGMSLGCSDVELSDMDSNILASRLKKIKVQDKITIGTAAFLDVGWKGQEYVIRAVAELKKAGYIQFEYQMIGSGTGKRLKQIATELGVNDQVRIIGEVSHDQVFSWLDSIDIYVQSSFQEGICRALVEAMSRACPVVCSDVGGNYELVPSECLFKKADYKQLAKLLMKMTNKDEQEIEARRNFDKAKAFDRKLLDEKRDIFYKKFIHNVM